jgi:endonuclease/exonuclease/phosphatase family metal-dependent hydrolase
MTIKNYLMLTGILLCFAQCQKEELGDPAIHEETSQSQTTTLKSASTAGQFSILTYNVAGLPQILSSATNRDVYTPIIGELVNDYDIVNVQEDFNYHAALYGTNLHPYRTSTSGGVPFGDGLNTMSDFPFTDFTRVQWNDCNGTDCLTPKGFSFMRIRLDEGAYIDLYNAHPNAGSEEADLSARRSNITQLSQFITNHSQGNAVIVMGDMNCRYTRAGDNIRELITNNGLTDVWIQVERNGDYPTQGGDALVCSWPDFNDVTCEVVDKIFYRSSQYINLNPGSYQLDDDDFVSPDGTEPLSDHYPLIANFDYSLSTDYLVSDLFGGPHGTPFNDFVNLTTTSTPIGFTLKAGSRVDNVGVSFSDGSAYYQLQNRGTGLLLDGMGRTTNGSVLGQYASTTHQNAQWELIDAGSGFYQILNRGTGLVADGYGRTTNGSDCAQYASTTTHPNSHWMLQPYEGLYYRIQNRGTGLFLDGLGYTNNGAACGQWANTTHPNAQWLLLSASSGTTLSHGGSGGTAYNLTLSPGEYVNYVKMCSGEYDGHTRIFYIEMRTNQGRVLSGGSQTSNTMEFNIPSGWKLAGFYGNSGDEVDKLGLIYTRL